MPENLYVEWLQPFSCLSFKDEAIKTDKKGNGLEDNTEEWAHHTWFL